MAIITKVFNRNNVQYDLADDASRTTISTLPTKAQIINYFYPVGSIYISTSSANPSTTMTGTTWERIQDRMLLSAGSSYTAGTTSGNATHTLTTDEMPSHNHSFSGIAVNTGEDSQAHAHYSNKTSDESARHNHGGTVTAGDSHTHTTKKHTHTVYGHSVGYTGSTSGGKTDGSGAYNGTLYAATGTTGNNVGSHSHTSISMNNPNRGHYHSFTSNENTTGHTHSITASGSIGNTGSGTAFNILPPYYAVYVWKRTA